MTVGLKYQRPKTEKETLRHLGPKHPPVYTQLQVLLQLPQVRVKSEKTSLKNVSQKA